MKKILLSLMLLAGIHYTTKAQQSITITPGSNIIAPGINLNPPTAGTSGLRFNNLNSGTTVSTTPTKVLSLDASGNVILGNAASGGATPTTINVPRYVNQFNLSFNIPSPVAGMLAYLDDVNRYVYYNGTAWVSFPLNPWVSSGGVTSTTEPIATGGFSTDAQLNVFKTTTTDASPIARFSTGISGQIVTRFGSNSGAGSNFRGNIYNTVSTASVGVDAFVSWKHVQQGGAVTTPMMTLTGAGDILVNGFTKLGGEADAPSIKQKYMTGSTNSSATVFSTLIAHGLDVAKIISMDVLVVGFNNISPPTNTWYPPAYRGTNNGASLANEYWAYFDATNITIERSTTQGQNLVNKNYRIVITYIQ